VQITEIIVNAGRTFNHPYEQYSNLRPSVTMKATLSEGDDAVAATKELQAKAEELVEDHKQNLLKQLEELYNLTERQREAASLEAGLRKAQLRLNEIREEFPQLSLAAAVGVNSSAADSDV
jgi:tRNA U34 5-methylaminomethyl-2-thiouridine-forming methyltransferase MnmC